MFGGLYQYSDRKVGAYRNCVTARVALIVFLIKLGWVEGRHYYYFIEHFRATRALRMMPAL